MKRNQLLTAALRLAVGTAVLARAEEPETEPPTVFPRNGKQFQRSGLRGVRRESLLGSRLGWDPDHHLERQGKKRILECGKEFYPGRHVWPRR